MADSLSRVALNRLLTACLASLALSGCAQVNDWLRGNDSGEDSGNVIVGAPDADVYLAEMYRLASGDPATQAEIFADAQAAATITPNPSSRLRLALVLATPGHPESNPDEAQNMFRDLLSQTELMTTGEVSLATIHLSSVEQRLMLGRETERLRDESSRAANTEQRAVEQRIARVEAENRRLRESLAEAEEKLEAITTIERSIREQTDNGINQ